MARASKATKPAVTAKKHMPKKDNATKAEAAPEVPTASKPQPQGELSNPLWISYAANRSIENRNALVVQYLPLAESIARRISFGIPTSVGFDLLYSAACVGLTKAVERFDLDRKILFASYAVLPIRGACLDELRASDSISRLDRKTKIERNQTLSKLREKFSREPTDQEVDDEMCTTAAPPRRNQPIPPPKFVSLSLPLASNAHRELTFAETVAGQTEPLRQDQLDFLEKTTRGLDLLSRMIMYLYFHRCLTMQQIGWVLDMSESRVSQMTTQATAWLKTNRDRNEMREEMEG